MSFNFFALCLVIAKGFKFERYFCLKRLYSIAAESKAFTYLGSKLIKWRPSSDVTLDNATYAWPHVNTWFLMSVTIWFKVSPWLLWIVMALAAVIGNWNFQRGHYWRNNIIVNISIDKITTNLMQMSQKWVMHVTSYLQSPHEQDSAHRSQHLHCSALHLHFSESLKGKSL